MFNFLRSLLGFTDRAEVATQRAAAALEGIADDLEEVRRQVRQQFGLVQVTPIPALPEAEERVNLADVPEEPEPVPAKNGRKRKT